MKLSKKTLSVYIHALLISTLVVVFNFYRAKYSCGIGTSIIVESQGIKMAETVLKHKHIMEFVGPSGCVYNLELSLYSYNKSFINRLIFNKNNSNIKLNKRDLYNSYNHVFMNFYMEQVSTKKYLTKELSDNWELSRVNIDQISEILGYNAISMLLTKQYLSEIVTQSGDLLEVENLPFSDYLVTGEKTVQYLNTVVHIINGGGFLKLVEKFSDPIFIMKLLEDQEKIELFENIIIDKDCINFINNFLNDYIQLNTKKGLFIPKTNIILDSFEVKENIANVSKFIIQAEKNFKQESILSDVRFLSKFKSIFNE